MIDRIIEFSGANKFLVFILIGFAVAAGIYSMRTIPLDAIPDLSDTQVIVYSRWDRRPGHYGSSGHLPDRPPACWGRRR